MTKSFKPLPYTFGIEIELALASVSFEQSHPDPGETRFVHFQTVPTQPSEFRANIEARKHIANTLQKARFPVNTHIVDPYFSDEVPDEDHTQWQITVDQSIEAPYPNTTKYPDDNFLPIEIKSPILPFTVASLKAVEDIYKLLTSNYVCTTNQSTGMHIHIGDGQQGFALTTVKHLALFLWAFEPQLNSLHPTSRQNIQYSKSLRNRSLLAEDWHANNGERITPLQGFLSLLNCQTIEQITKQLSDRSDLAGKPYSYNLSGLRRLASGKRMDDFKPTVEFRQHDATLDGKAATMWIRTIGGIMEFVKKGADPLAFYGVFKDYLGGPYNEKWEKLGDGNDAEREALHGPIIAERDFTVIDLFTYMGLQESANYYRDKWHVHDMSLTDPQYRKPRRRVRLSNDEFVSVSDLPPLLTTWEYEMMGPESEGYESNKELRVLWEHMKRLKLSNSDSGIIFEPDHEMWPKHTTLKLAEPGQSGVRSAQEIIRF